jgi:hypothetical protein
MDTPNNGGRGVTVPAIMEYLRLWDILSTITLGEGEDKLIWRWTADGAYSSKSAYRALFMAATWSGKPGHRCGSKYSYGSPSGNATGRRIEDADTGLRQQTAATFVTRSQKPLTISSPLVRSRDKSGGTS